VAEIGGDLASPVVDTEPYDRGSLAEGERGGRRSRRSRGGRNRFPPRVSDNSYLGGEPGDAEVQAPRDETAPAGEPEAQAPAPKAAEPSWPNEAAQAREEPSEVATHGQEPDISEAHPTGIASGQTAEVETAEVAFVPVTAEEPPAPAAASAEREPEGASEPSEPVDETPRPRRTGWWQRARASIVGS